MNSQDQNFNQQINQDPNQTLQLDPKVIQLAKSIRQVESNNNFNAIGDQGNSKGAYQFNSDHFQKWATQYGLDPNDMSPENQNKVAYYKIKDWKDQGYQPGEIAAMWNGAHLENGRPVANNPDYVQKVKQFYQSQSNSNQNGYVTPPPISTSVSPEQNNNDQTQQNQQPENNWQKAGDVIKGVGNFLFPIVGDVYNDVTGKSNKSFLQQVGDTALSALPFIPGLGEVGEGARGTEAAVEGGEAIARDSGLIGKLINNPTTRLAVKGAGVGYGAGVAQNLSQGQSLGKSFVPNINNILGAGFGGATPIALKTLGTLATKFSGISPQIRTALQDAGISVQDYNKYINAAKLNAQDVRAPAPLTLAADELDKASNKIDQNLSQAGKAVGSAKSTLGNVKLPDLSNVSQDFASRVENDYGLKLTQDPQGIVHAIPLPDRTPSISPIEIQRIEATAQNLVGLQGSTALNATDVISKIDNSINYAKATSGLHPFDPIENLLSSVRQGIDGSVRSVAPDLAAANDRFSSLARLQKEVTSMAGGQNQRGELLMKRIFSGDKSGDVQDIFNKIKSETGIDLVNHAALAKHAVETVGSKTQKSLLEQAIQGGVEAHTGGLLPALLNTGKNVVRKVAANPERIGRNIVKGGSNGLIGSLISKAAIEASSRNSTNP